MYIINMALDRIQLPDCFCSHPCHPFIMPRRMHGNFQQTASQLGFCVIPNAYFLAAQLLTIVKLLLCSTGIVAYNKAPVKHSLYHAETKTFKQRWDNRSQCMTHKLRNVVTLPKESDVPCGIVLLQERHNFFIINNVTYPPGNEQRHSIGFC